MYSKSVENFYQTLVQSDRFNENLKNKLQKIRDEDEYEIFIREDLIPIAKTMGYELSVDDILSYERQKLQSLSEEELERVSGGAGAMKNISLVFISALAMAGGMYALQEMHVSHAMKSSSKPAKKDMSGQIKRKLIEKIAKVEKIDELVALQGELEGEEDSLTVSDLSEVISKMFERSEQLEKASSTETTQRPRSETEVVEVKTPTPVSDESKVTAISTSRDVSHRYTATTAAGGRGGSSATSVNQAQPTATAQRNVILGTWQLSEAETEKAVYDWISLGGRRIDTAVLYENEVEVGRAVQRCIDEGWVKREELTVSSKLPMRQSESARSYKRYRKDDEVVAVVEKSYVALGSNPIDIYFIHEMPENPTEEIPTIIDGLIEAKRLGLIKRIGVSNVGAAELKDGSLAPFLKDIEVVQNAFFLGYSKDYDEIVWEAYKMIDFCRERKIEFQAYKALGHGILLGKKIVGSADVCLNYCISQGACPVVQTTNPDHMRENLSCDGKFDQEVVSLEYEDTMDILQAGQLANRGFY